MKGRSKGFLLVEVLIASLILTGCIVASYYLLKSALDYHIRAQKVNQLSKKVPQAIAFLENIADLDKKSGETTFEGLLLRWEAKPLERTKLVHHTSNRTKEMQYEIILYDIKFTLINDDYFRNFNFTVVRYRTLSYPL